MSERSTGSFAILTANGTGTAKDVRRSPTWALPVGRILLCFGSLVMVMLCNVLSGRSPLDLDPKGIVWICLIELLQVAYLTGLVMIVQRDFVSHRWLRACGMSVAWGVNLILLTGYLLATNYCDLC